MGSFSYQKWERICRSDSVSTKHPMDFMLYQFYTSLVLSVNYEVCQKVWPIEFPHSPTDTLHKCSRWLSSHISSHSRENLSRLSSDWCSWNIFHEFNVVVFKRTCISSTNHNHWLIDQQKHQIPHAYTLYRVSQKTGISVQGSFKALKWPEIKKSKKTNPT